MKEQARSIFVLLLGMPGAGKGTQARLLVQCRGYIHISSGQIFRDHVAQATEFGRLVADYMAQGKIGPDDVIVKMSLEKVTHPPAPGYIFDGVPRNIAQAHLLDEGLGAINACVHRAVYLRLSEKESIHRLLSRIVCERCGEPFDIDNAGQDARCTRCGGSVVRRGDDNRETIRKRVAVYNTETRPVVNYYKERGLLAPVDASQAAPAVHEAILEAIDSSSS
jgi:adenylate kinase